MNQKHQELLEKVKPFLANAFLPALVIAQLAEVDEAELVLVLREHHQELGIDLVRSHEREYRVRNRGRIIAANDLELTRVRLAAIARQQNIQRIRDIAEVCGIEIRSIEPC